MATKFKPSDELKKEQAEYIHPLNADLQDYKESLGDGSRPFRGLATGFDEIDEIIGGLDRFILLAGRSGAGKTTLALQLALGVAQHKPVIIYSFEMSRNEIITSLLKATAHRLGLEGLYTKTIELQGNDPNLPSNVADAIAQSLTELDRTGERVFIKDSSQGIPAILPYPTQGKTDKSPTIYDDIERVKKICKSDEVLVLIDSVQDVVDTSNPNQVQAEIKAVNDLTILQQKTGATILVTAQKNKGSVNSQDSYGDVMGSMSFIHKPNTVIELVTLAEMINKADKDHKEKIKDLADEIEQESKQGNCKPMFLNVIKGRFTGVESLPLKFYGAYGYFEAGQDKNYSDAYKLF
jgi:replicative DNA helicase